MLMSFFVMADCIPLQSCRLERPFAQLRRGERRECKKIRLGPGVRRQSVLHATKRGQLALKDIIDLPRREPPIDDSVHQALQFFSTGTLPDAGIGVPLGSNGCNAYAPAVYSRTSSRTRPRNRSSSPSRFSVGMCSGTRLCSCRPRPGADRAFGGPRRGRNTDTTRLPPATPYPNTSVDSILVVGIH